MTTLMLVAASGLAREVIALERRRNRYDDLLLVDDDPSLWGASVDGVPVVGHVTMAAEPFEGDVVICAGSGRARRSLARRLEETGLSPSRYGRVIHPDVDVPAGCTVGHGSILLASVVMTAGVHVHRHVVAMPNVTLTHDDIVGDFATLCAGVSLGGRVSVAEGAYLGMNSSVRERVDVGRDAILGMGAVLLQDLPAGEIWVGTPARSLTSRKQLVP